MAFRSLVIWLLLAVSPQLLASEVAPVVLGTSYEMHSTRLGEDRSYEVSLPRSYEAEPSRRYPVLYVLDGESLFLLTATTTNFLAAQGEIPEMIVVGITSTVRIRDFTQSDWAEAWVGGGGADNFARFLKEELIPKVEGDFRTDGFRVLSGHSAGGQFALHALSAHPSLFRAYLAMAPSLDWHHNLPKRELQKALDGATSLPAFVYFAYADDYEQALADDEALVATLRSRQPAGFRWQSRHFPDESHGSLPVRAGADALRSLYAGYRLSGDALRGASLSDVERHYRTVSEKLGWPLKVPESAINDLGYGALNNGRIRDALALFKRNCRDHPESANAWDSLADALEKAGQFRQAADAADKAVALARTHRLANQDAFARHAEKLHRLLQ